MNNEITDTGRITERFTGRFTEMTDTSIILGTIEQKTIMLTDKIISIISNGVIDYNNNSIINKTDTDYQMNTELCYSDRCQTMYQNFWTSLFSAIKNMIIDMRKSNNNNNNNNNSYQKFILNNEQYMSKIIDFFEICIKYDTAITKAFLTSNHSIMINLLGEFMSSYNIIIILLSIENVNTVYIKHVITSMKRWETFKPDYLLDPIRIKYLKFMVLIEKLLDKTYDKEKILELLIAFIDIIVNQEQVDNTPINIDNMIDIRRKVIDLAVHNKSVSLMDIFRNDSDLIYYADIIKYNISNKCVNCNISQISSAKLIKILSK